MLEFMMDSGRLREIIFRRQRLLHRRRTSSEVNASKQGAGC
jgi:hypothetical protein